MRILVKVPKELTPRQVELLKEFDRIEQEKKNTPYRSFWEKVKDYFKNGNMLVKVKSNYNFLVTFILFSLTSTILSSAPVLVN